MKIIFLLKNFVGKKLPGIDRNLFQKLIFSMSKEEYQNIYDFVGAAMEVHATLGVSSSKQNRLKHFAQNIVHNFLTTCALVRSR